MTGELASEDFEERYRPTWKGSQQRINAITTTTVEEIKNTSYKKYNGHLTTERAYKTVTYRRHQ